MLGAPPVWTAAPPESMRTICPLTAGATARTPSSAVMVSMSARGTPLELRSSADTRTSTPCAVFSKMESNVFWSVSVKTKEPATNAVPSTTDSTVSASRTLCAARLRSDTLRIGALDVDAMRSDRRVGREGVGGLVESLHRVEDRIGRRVPQFVDDLAVGEEDHPVGVGRRPGIVRDDDDGLVELVHRGPQDGQHLA